jgi:4-amino-4-deoxy-L-arabinose transferase-like glycosyltransferase
MEDHPIARHPALAATLVAAAIYLGCVISPPALMDDVDAVQAQIARNMLDSGDWVTARLNGIAYLEKAPGPYWMMAASYAFFGVRDWAARLPFALSAIALAFLTARFGAWAFSHQTGFYAGLATTACAGLWLFTRIAIPDVTLTLTIALAMWAFLRTEEGDQGPWPWLMWAAMGVGFLLKGLIALVFPLGAAGLYLLLTGQLFTRSIFARFRVFSGVALVAAICLPWVALAMLRNPPLFDFTMHSGPGEYHGFFWFFFFNEHLFRFLNMRWPRDYNTVPRHLFWLLHLAWLFPWSVYLPQALRSLPTRTPRDRAARTRLLAWCWAGFLLVFFTLSTTQEYYSMPAYPALALLIGDALTRESRWLNIGTRVLAVITSILAAALGLILFGVRNIPTPGDISQALTSNPDAYTLSLGHMQDLTLPAFAYLRTPLLIAALAFFVGAIAAWRFRGERLALGLAAMMVLFTQAARLALVGFDPYLSSRPLAEALLRAPAGDVILDNQYYTFSSVFFYAHERLRNRALLLNGRVNNLEYGSYAPGAPRVFIDDHTLATRWAASSRCYLFLEGPQLGRIANLVGRENLHIVKESGGKLLLTNQPFVKTENTQTGWFLPL